MSRFHCPACGFAVFNRRVAVCEKCSAPLPAHVRFTDAELAVMEAEAARVGKIREALAADAERMEEEKRRRRGDGG